MLKTSFEFENGQEATNPLELTSTVSRIPVKHPREHIKNIVEQNNRENQIPRYSVTLCES